MRSADRIAVLEGGKITACADHETLMQTSETYRDIYHSQLKEEEERLEAEIIKYMKES